MNNPDYLHLLAKYILRLHRYYTETFPAVIVVPIIGFFIALMGVGMNLDFHETITFWQFMGRVAVLASKMVFLAKIVIYLGWEGYYGCIALKEWATNYHYAKKEN